ncbi:hypothetical protein ACOT81_18900 [Streptomyces sp. WI04-05B]|uniref:hypothetical protein n=1 Tax=Streptomyces TaxID=1883 RepID=UPI0029A6B28A|nr:MULTISPECIES: hypothetical protein [unclassified Streptomyces]MDX2542546.1 hypothetical protein [Streptomyces sp. WI04-05B]MDX2582435.1 hypothetical protein [Streptomyces sp. WI04-05A]MDX3747848.1 hypothetical protein [Streptomyces sp. AK08-02]
MAHPENIIEVESDHVPNGFNLVPPPGWDSIPLQSGTREAIQRIVRKSVSQLPVGFPKDDIPQARLRLTKELKQAVRQTRNSSGLTLYLPVERMHGMLIPASFVASEPLGSPTGASEPEAVLIDLARDSEDASARELDGTAAIRTLQKLPARPAKGVEVPSWRVQYTVPIPNSTPAQWLTFSFSTLITPGTDIEFTETLVELFDAVMTTFRWSYA